LLPGIFVFVSPPVYKRTTEQKEKVNSVIYVVYLLYWQYMKFVCLTIKTVHALTKHCLWKNELYQIWCLLDSVLCTVYWLSFLQFVGFIIHIVKAYIKAECENFFEESRSDIFAIRQAASSLYTDQPNVLEESIWKT